MCEACMAAVDRCAEEIAVLRSLGEETVVSGRVLIDLDDDEAPHMWTYDRKLFCGGYFCNA